MSRFIYDTSRWLAWLGTLLLTALAVLSVASIAGRAFSFAGLGPVPGDFELVEAGTALVVFCFLPWCYVQRGHAQVDMLWHWYPRPMQRTLDALSDLLMLFVWTLLVWRMGVSMLEYRANGEVSFILQMPVWWGYAFSIVPAAFSLLVYLWRLLETLGVVEPLSRHAPNAAPPAVPTEPTR